MSIKDQTTNTRVYMGCHGVHNRPYKKSLNFAVLAEKVNFAVVAEKIDFSVLAKKTDFPILARNPDFGEKPRF